MRPDPTDGGRRRDGTDRGQAYTLEGVIGAVLLLTALLFSVQSLVVTPTTGGAVDGAVRSGLEREAADVLATSAADGALSRTVRYWNNTTVERTFAGGVRPGVGYGNATPPTSLGAMLEARFERRGYRFNVDVAYLAGPDRWETVRLVYRGVPSEDAVAATHPVTLYDDDELAGPHTANETLGAAHRRGMYPIPDVAPDGPLYNVVEVRLVVW